jgi:hypothetical protein
MALLSDFFSWLRGILDPYNNLITALATLSIAVFTVVLACVSRRQTKLIEKQIDLARKEFTTTSRAFIFIDGFDTILHTRDIGEGPGKVDLASGQKLDNFLFPGYFSVQPRWKNSGTTETQDMKISVCHKFFDGDPEPDFIFGYKESPGPFFVGANAVQLSKKIEVATDSVLQVVMLANGTPLKGASSNPLLLVWGRADYWDIFDKGHSMEWCYKIGVAAPERKLIATFTQYGEYNRAYENQNTRPNRDKPGLAGGAAN